MIVNRHPLAGIAKLASAWQPDLARATRATAGLILPLLLAETGRIPLHVIFAAIAAQNVAMADVRGSYSLRLAILSSGVFLLGLAAALGSMSSQHLWLALLLTALMAVVAGISVRITALHWPRHSFLFSCWLPPRIRTARAFLVTCCPLGLEASLVFYCKWPSGRFVLSIPCAGPRRSAGRRRLTCSRP